MQRRRGLVSQPAPTNPTHASTNNIGKRQRRSGSSDGESSSSDSEASSATLSDSEEQQIEVQQKEGEPTPEQSTEAHKSRSEGIECDPKTAKPKKKNRRDFSDESRWQKMKVKGADGEVMVDLTRIQKYVDYDSATVQSYQSELQSAKGNFRQQSMADYSDL